MRHLFVALGLFAVVALGATAANAQTTTSTTTSTSSTTLVSVTWGVILNGSCTAAQAATGTTSATVDCCTAPGQGFCTNYDTSGGTAFQSNVTFASGTNMTYTTGGNAITAANLAKIPITNIASMYCGQATSGRTIYAKFTSASGKRAPTIMLSDGAAEVGSAALVQNQVFECMIRGY